MKKRRQTLAALLSAAMVLGLAACGTANEAPAKEGNAGTAAEEEVSEVQTAQENTQAQEQPEEEKNPVTIQFMHSMVEEERLNRHIQHIRLNLSPRRSFGPAAGSDQLLLGNLHAVKNLFALFQVIHHAFHGSPGHICLVMLHSQAKIHPSCLRVIERRSLSGQIRQEYEALTSSRYLRDFPVQFSKGPLISQYFIFQPA